ncbi:hypothetical protein NMG60_11019186 [Bertholletia excelsa]
MSSVRAYSSSDLFPSSKDTEHPDDSSLQGVPATVKLLLKLIEDEKEASSEEDGNKRMLRVTSIMTILDNVRTRIQNCQSLGNKKEAELRRCKTDLQKPINVPRDKRVYIEPADDKEKLRRELNACLASRKSLEAMCSSLGKEKEIMAAELARKVHELNEVEELVNDLKVQNETLMKKIQECARDHRERRKHSVGGEAIVNAALQERNKALSEQLLKSLEGYKSMKRRLKKRKRKMRQCMPKWRKWGRRSRQDWKGFGASSNGWRLGVKNR